MVDIRIEGLDALRKTLKELPDALQRGANSPIRFGLRKAANVVRDETKALAPSDSGQLRDSITVRLTPKKQRKPDIIGMQVIPKGQEHVAGWVEFGTGQFHTGQSSVIKPKRDQVLFDASSGTFYGAHASGQRPQPFLRPALERSHEAATQAFVKGFEQKLARLERKK